MLMAWFRCLWWQEQYSSTGVSFACHKCVQNACNKHCRIWCKNRTCWFYDGSFSESPIRIGVSPPIAGETNEGKSGRGADQYTKPHLIPLSSGIFNFRITAILDETNVICLIDRRNEM